jgi:hypothetical protein
MFEKTSLRICYYNIYKPHTLFGSIYFKTRDSTYLLSDDYKVLNELIDLCSILTVYSKVALFFEGFADRRGGDIFNKRLSEARVKTVRDYVDRELSSSSNYISFGLGYGKIKSAMDFPEDRRVDIFITQILKEVKNSYRIKESNFIKPYYEPGTTYPYQEICDNPDLYTSFVLKYYHPDYIKLWKPLQGLINIAEKLSVINQIEYINQFVKTEHYEYVARLIDHYFPIYESQEGGFKIEKVLTGLLSSPPNDEYGLCFRIIYLREYFKAFSLAVKDFDKSQYRYFCEWWGKKLNKVPPNTPFKKK